MNSVATQHQPTFTDQPGEKYDVAVIGGGLAGLALSIQCAKTGYSVVLFEKEQYPFHKVCGEYISLESWKFLETLGLPLAKMNLPIIQKLQVSAPNGKYLEHRLPLGGFGISRYKIDAMLARLAKANGVTVMENTKVNDILFDNNRFKIKTASGVSPVQGMAVAAGIEAAVVAGTFGKRSNLDINWKRKFTEQKPNKLNNYIGVKYHIRFDFPADQIALHNFRNGYCGISRVEEGKYCLCYITTAKNLNDSNNSIREMEQKILHQNPFLKMIFCNAVFISKSPLVISQISFDKKLQVENHALMIGDAAGMITPLCGNGMSMALHGSKLAYEQVNAFLQTNITRAQMEANYMSSWKKTFSKRLYAGRIIQRFFGSAALSNFLITTLKPFPLLVNKLITATHGQPF